MFEYVSVFIKKPDIGWELMALSSKPSNAKKKKRSDDLQTIPHNNMSNSVCFHVGIHIKINSLLLWV
jgi:hypothetical protein